MNSFVVLVGFGLALHILVGAIAGLVLVRLTGSNDHSRGRVSQWVVFVFGLLVMIAYGFAAGHLAKALRNHDAILVTFAVIMLVACLITYLRRRDTVAKS